MSEISGGSAENDEMNTPETGGETGQTGSGGTEGLAGGNMESVQLDEGSEVPPAAPAAEITPALATEVFAQGCGPGQPGRRQHPGGAGPWRGGDRRLPLQ